jgi:hypothetical protein
MIPTADVTLKPWGLLSPPLSNPASQAGSLLVTGPCPAAVVAPAWQARAFLLTDSPGG